MSLLRIVSLKLIYSSKVTGVTVYIPASFGLATLYTLSMGIGNARFFMNYLFWRVTRISIMEGKERAGQETRGRGGK